MQALAPMPACQLTSQIGVTRLVSDDPASAHRLVWATCCCSEMQTTVGLLPAR